MGILVTDFEEKTEPFAIFTGFKNAVTCFACVIAGYLSINNIYRMLANSPPYIMLIIVGIMSVIGFCSSMFFKFKLDLCKPVSTEGNEELIPLP